MGLIKKIRTLFTTLFSIPLFCLFLCGGVFFGCVGSQLPRDLAKPNATVSEGDKITGEFVSSDNQSFQLQSFSQVPLVVMFAQVTCLVCRSEAEGIRAVLAQGFQIPAQAKLITIIVASDAEEAKDWKERLSVPWTVGATENNEIMKPYCPSLLTPCTVVQLPQKGIIKIKQGEMHPEEIWSLVSGH